MKRQSEDFIIGFLDRREQPEIESSRRCFEEVTREVEDELELDHPLKDSVLEYPPGQQIIYDVLTSFMEEKVVHRE